MTEQQPWNELIAREEAKRMACWNPLQRWQVLQQMIAWAEAQAVVRRNTPARCLELERAKLAAIDADPARC